MKLFILPIAKNVYGANALDLFYEGINASWPQYGFTKENSTILLVQPLGQVIGDAVLKICKKATPDVIEHFVFYRHPITNFMKNPAFSAAELATIATLTTSEQLLKFIAVKYNVNLTADDIWISINDIPKTGGQSVPNWLMRCRYNSLFWYGDLAVWLHPGP